MGAGARGLADFPMFRLESCLSVWGFLSRWPTRLDIASMGGAAGEDPDQNAVVQLTLPGVLTAVPNSCPEADVSLTHIAVIIITACSVLNTGDSSSRERSELGMNVKVEAEVRWRLVGRPSAFHGLLF